MKILSVRYWTWKWRHVGGRATDKLVKGAASEPTATALAVALHMARSNVPHEPINCPEMNGCMWRLRTVIRVPSQRYDAVCETARIFRAEVRVDTSMASCYEWAVSAVWIEEDVGSGDPVQYGDSWTLHNAGC